jgi:hypothetical protein
MTNTTTKNLEVTMNNNKQTAVDYLYREMLFCDAELNANVIDAATCIERKMRAYEHAKKMEAEQIAEHQQPQVELQKCDNCGFSPSVIYRTNKGTLCKECMQKLK